MIEISAAQDDRQKTKEQLIEELDLLRRQVTALQLQAAERQAAAEALRRETSEHRHVQAALLEEREISSAILNTAGTLVVVLDPRGHIVRFNHACEELTGYRFSEVAGRLLWDTVLLPSERQEVEAIFDELSTGNFPNAHENYWVARDGTRHLIAWSNTALLDDEERVKFVIGTGIDITRRRQAETRTNLLLKLTGIIFEAPSLPAALDAVLELVCDYIGGALGEAWMPTPDNSALVYHHTALAALEPLKVFQQSSASYQFAPGEGLVGRVWQTQEPEWIWDLSQTSRDTFLRARLAQQASLQAALAVPIIYDEQVLAVLVFYMTETPGEDQTLMALLSNIALQLGSVVQRKQAEDALRRSERRFRELTENIEEVFWIISPNRSELLYISPAYETIWQRPTPPLQTPFPDTLLDAVHADDRALVVSRFRRLSDQDYRTTVEFRILSPEDETRWVRAQTFPIYDEDGDVYWIAGNMVDITWRKRAERALRESEEKFRALLESAPVAIIVVDRTGSIRLVNSKTIDMFGYTRSELLGASLERLLPKRTHTLHANHILRFFENPHPRAMGQFMTLEGQRKNEEAFPVEVGLSSIRVRGELLAVSYVTDITERRRAEEALQAERLRISMDLHDGVIQSLYAIGMHLTLMESPESSYREITRSIDSVIEDIRDYILNLKATTENSRTLYEYLVQEILVRLHIPETVKMEIDVPNVRYPLTGTHFEALCQMANEVISNAVRHANASHIAIRARRQDDWFEMVIRDDGEGFELAEAFARDGLGIRNLYERARLHGGTITIESAIGDGTTVTISLPASD